VRWLLYVALIFVLVGCTLNDPTESTFSARFVNNLGYDVRLGSCESEMTCRGGLHYRESIQRGRSISENISPDGYIQPFRIETASGHVVGCLFVVATHFKRNLVISLARMSSCTARRVIHVT
jgi:hypothetical protein